MEVYQWQNKLKVFGNLKCQRWHPKSLFHQIPFAISNQFVIFELSKPKFIVSLLKYDYIKMRFDWLSLEWVFNRMETHRTQTHQKRIQRTHWNAIVDKSVLVYFARGQKNFQYFSSGKILIWDKNFFKQVENVIFRVEILLY